jgi:hypothetical protein
MAWRTMDVSEQRVGVCGIPPLRQNKIARMGHGADGEGQIGILVSHPFRKEREMDGARCFCGSEEKEKQPHVLRLAALTQSL